jgi:hypothetical protein
VLETSQELRISKCELRKQSHRFERYDRLDRQDRFDINNAVLTLKTCRFAPE